MANSLKRKIENGEIVIINPAVLHEQYRADARFKVTSGFGMMPFTVGSKIFGIWLADGSQEVFDANDIAVEATLQWQGSHGKFGERLIFERPQQLEGTFELPNGVFVRVHLQFWTDGQLSLSVSGWQRHHDPHMKPSAIMIGDATWNVLLPEDVIGLLEKTARISKEGDSK